jgi:branched-chain amino acid transport system permease protein
LEADVNAPPRTTAAFIAIVVAAAYLPVYGSEYAVAIALSLAMWVALTQSWTLLCGLTGYGSFGHVVFYGIGAYLQVLAWDVMPPWVSVPLAGLVSCAFAVVVGYPALKVRGPYFVMLTFGMAEFVKFGIIGIEAKLGQFSRMILGGPSPDVLYRVMLALAAAATLLMYGISHSRFGYALRAIRENEEAAETVGIPVAQYKLGAFALSALIPGMVGAVMAMRLSYFEPSQAFDPVISFNIVTMAMIGGTDDARGPLLGALFLIGLSELLWSRAPQLYMIIVGLLLITCVLFAPEGLARRVFTRRARVRVA